MSNGTTEDNFIWILKGESIVTIVENNFNKGIDCRGTWPFM